MKRMLRNLFYCALVLMPLYVSCAPIPPTIIADIIASDMTPALQSFVAVTSNLADTDADGNTTLWLAANNSKPYFFVQLFNLNPTGFALYVNQANNFNVTPVCASLSNPYGKNAAILIIEFLLRHGAQLQACSSSLSDPNTPARDGSLDPSFGGGTGFIDGPSGFASAVNVQTDGKIVVVGSNTVGITLTVRYNSDGTLDTTFGINGIVTDTTGIFALDIAVQPDGKIIIAGVDATFQNFQVIRYNSNGTLDTTFGSGGVVTGPQGLGFALALQSDSKIILVGTDIIAGLFKVVRYNSNGSIDTIFQSGPDEFASGVVIQNDGKVVVAGSTNTFNLRLVRYNTDGTLDSSFVAGASPSGIWGPVLLQPDGKIIVAGNTFVPTLELARFNPDGSLDTTFGGGVIAGPPGLANSVLLQADGKSVILGAPTFAGPTFQLVRYTSAGTLDPSFGIGGIVQAPSGIVAFNGALQSDGKIIAVGSDLTFTLFQVARYISHPPLVPTTLMGVTRGCNTITFTGTAQNPSVVYLLINNQVVGGTYTDVSGGNTWSLTIPTVCNLSTIRIVSIYNDRKLNIAGTIFDRMWLQNCAT